jgi:hypothetical protein
VRGSHSRRGLVATAWHEEASRPRVASKAEATGGTGTDVPRMGEEHGLCSGRAPSLAHRLGACTAHDWNSPLSSELVETIARRAAELALPRLEARTAIRAKSPLMSVPEAAAYLRCKEQRVYELRSSRKLTPLSEGGRALCDRAEVEALVVEEVVRRRPRP